MSALASGKRKDVEVAMICLQDGFVEQTKKYNEPDTKSKAAKA